MTRRPWKDSLGVTHLIPDNLLLKGGPAGIVRQPATEGAFRLLVDELRAFRDRRRRAAEKVKSTPINTRDAQAERQAERISRNDHLPTVRARPGRPGAKTGTAPKPLTKSLSQMADELAAMTKTVRDGTERIQRQNAIALLDDLASAARAGRLDALSAAKLDALRHANATALGLTATGIRS